MDSCLAEKDFHSTLHLVKFIVVGFGFRFVFVLRGFFRTVNCETDILMVLFVRLQYEANETTKHKKTHEDRNIKIKIKSKHSIKGSQQLSASSRNQALL